MKKRSLFSSCFLSLGACIPAIATVTSCSINNKCNFSILNDGNFKMSQQTATKGEKCKLYIEDKNINEAIIGVKAITSSGQLISDDNWECAVKGKKTILITFYATATTDDICIELKTEPEEDIYDELEIATSGVTTETKQLLEGQNAEIVFKCSSSSQIVDSIERINTHPGEISSSFYNFDYENQKLTINGEAIHSENQKISINLNVTDKNHDVETICSDVNILTSQTKIENRGKLETTLLIDPGYQQTFQIADVIVKVGESILSRNEYTWLIDDIYSYKATVYTNENIQIKDDVDIIVYVSEKTTNLFNVFITDGSDVIEESPKMASQIAGLSQDIYNDIADSTYDEQTPITITAKNETSGKEIEVEPQYYHFDEANKRIIIQPEGVKGNIYIRKHLHSTKSFSDISWENLCHFANGGLDSLKELFSNYNITSFVGLEKTMPFGANPVTQYLRVIGENHDIISGEDNKKAALTFEFVRLFSTSASSQTRIAFGTKDGDTYVNSWYSQNTEKNSNIRVYLNDEEQTFFKGLPACVKDSVKTIVKERACIFDSPTKRQNIEDKIFVLTPCEICGDAATGKYPKDEGTKNNIQYELYKQNISTPTDGECAFRTKTSLKSSAGKNTYWLAGMDVVDKKNTCYIEAGSGKILTKETTTGYEISPVFCI